MDKEEMQPQKHEKTPVSKRTHRSKFTQTKLIISGIIFFVLLILVVFIQKPQTFIQQAATTNQASPSADSNCSPVPFYCIILGGGKTCTQPRVCPTQPPPPAFVAQSNPMPASGAANPNPNPGTGTQPQPATGSTTPASGSATTDCATPSAALMTKVIIHFDTSVGGNNGYTIRTVDKPALDKLAAALKSYPSAIVTINGYTDNVPFAPGTPGPINTNQALSLARAKAAETYLKSKGAMQNTYIVKGNGATNFVAKNNPTTGNILNRRDEITTNIKSKSCTPVVSTFMQPVCTNNVNWSGYLHRLPAKTAQASIATTWNVSAVTCSGKEEGISQWPGIDAGNKAISQLGTDSVCSNGKPIYYAWTENFPANPVYLPVAKYPVKPGDQLSAIVNETSLGNFSDTITNVTRKWSFTTPMKLGAAYTKLQLQQEIIIENEGYGIKPTVPGLTKFSQGNFTNNKFSENNGTAEPFSMAQGLYCINLHANANVLQDKTANMTNANFNITWVHQ